MIFRRKIHAWLLSGIVALGAAPAEVCCAATGKTFTAAVKRNLDEEARLIVNLLQNYHYSGRAFRDIENKEMIQRFLTELDPGKLVFSQADIDSVHRRFDRTLKTVYLYKGDMQPAQEIYALLVDRSRARFGWIERRLGEPFDLARQETVTPAELDRAADARAEDRRWELRLTNELIQAMLAGRDEAVAREFLLRHYRKVSRYGAGFDPYEVRAMFLDSIIRSFDPRSGYFSADSSREFALEMTGAVTGVGIDDGCCNTGYRPVDWHTGIMAAPG
jgi:carboxyl-terminal processing protease